LTLYAFSEQNWNRPEDEVEGLMELLSEYIISERHEILDNNIRFSTIGDLSKLSAPLREAIAELCHASRENTGMDFCIALSYGGREEILQAVKSCMRSAGEGTLSAADLTEALFESRLYSGHLPPVDLIIRTSGEQRLSNFLLWQAAYAELYFTPTPWPDFSEQDLDEAIRVFGTRDRRFGLTQEQIIR
ncbi:di-trans,poly-cis-decaprenylcistransferase, partial [Myxococcota bacterium]|nr:di-trans,poly-cis-decaprenylcistransferase [Myxococcota bacterium]